MNGMNGTNGASPVIMGAQVSLAASASAIPDLDKLTNPYATAMVIDEILFSLSVLMTTTGGARMGNYVRVILKVGGFEITRVPVPVWNFGVTKIDDDETVVGGTTPSTTMEFYKWRLPRPLYVLPGTAIIPTFYRSADTIAATVVATITYCGRVLPASAPVPHSIDVPYVGVFTPTITSTNLNPISGEHNLFNPLQQPLNVHRFIGRMLNVAGTTVATEYPRLGDNQLPSTCKVKITHLSGADIVPQFVSWHSLFKPARRSITMGPVQLPALTNYTAYIQGLPDATYLPSISMVGWRPEALS